MKYFIDRIKRKCYDLSQVYNQATIRREDSTVIEFLKQNVNTAHPSYIEVGSGLGRFVNIVSSLNKFNITCLEISPELAKKTSEMGYSTINIDILNNNIPDEQYDVVHCSHVIEHIAYPSVIKVLDQLIRITKNNGYIIIRSPLMSLDFFTCIDHIRPYPPKCIIDFYSNPQQQVVGKASIKKVKIKFRKEALLLFSYSENSFVLLLNLIMKLCWVYFKFPFSKPNGYTLILKKNI